MPPPIFSAALAAGAVAVVRGPQKAAVKRSRRLPCLGKRRLFQPSQLAFLFLLGYFLLRLLLRHTQPPFAVWGMLGVTRRLAGGRRRVRGGAGFGASTPRRRVFSHVSLKLGPHDSPVVSYLEGGDLALLDQACQGRPGYAEQLACFLCSEHVGLVEFWQLLSPYSLFCVILPIGAGYVKKIMNIAGYFRRFALHAGLISSTRPGWIDTRLGAVLACASCAGKSVIFCPQPRGGMR